jgi:hypothetical protein
MNTQRNTVSSPQIPSLYAGTQVRDISGYAVFSQGETGAAHALAHRMFDNGRLRLGHRLLGDWLSSHQGQGSDWVHLQFHMALFELALGDWDSAYGRFLSQVLPTAATTNEALTDAPALLWRLVMSAPEPVALPWQPLRRTVLNCIGRNTSPFVQIHHLLALAGAGDGTSIRGWLQHDKRHPVVVRFGLVCMALAERAYSEADQRLQAMLPNLTQIGGSNAQGQLFNQLSGWAERQNPARIAA